MSEVRTVVHLDRAVQRTPQFHRGCAGFAVPTTITKNRHWPTNSYRNSLGRYQSVPAIGQSAEDNAPADRAERAERGNELRPAGPTVAGARQKMRCRNQRMHTAVLRGMDNGLSGAGKDIHKRSANLESVCHRDAKARRFHGNMRGLRTCR